MEGLSVDQIPDMHEDREAYLRRRGVELQRSIVNVRSTTTATVESCIWTYRTTSCDVISLITTTVPIKNGAMNDLRYVNKEMKRIKAPIAKPGTFLATHPLLNKLNDAEVAARQRKNDTLKLEKRAFMSKLQASRYIRGTIENLAATFIQKMFRGHSTRRRADELRAACEQRKEVRARVREYLTDRLGLGDSLVLTVGQHRARRKDRMQRAALTIQCAFRCYIGRMTLLAQRRVEGARRSIKAIVRAQMLARMLIAKARVRRKRAANAQGYQLSGAVRIQAAVRRFLARRRVAKRRFRMRWVAARMLQCWFRHHRARAYVALAKHRLDFIRRFNGALAFQKIVRRRLALRRVQALAGRRLQVRLQYSLSKVQAVVRGYIARRRVRRLRRATQDAATAATAAAAAVAPVRSGSRVSSARPKGSARLSRPSSSRPGSRGGSARSHALCCTDPRKTAVTAFIQQVINRKLLAMGGEAGILFSYVHGQNMPALTELFNEESTAAIKAANTHNEFGDTAATFAAGEGLVDMVKFFLLRGLDLTKRNKGHETPLMAAVANGQLDVVRLLLAPEEDGVKDLLALQPGAGRVEAADGATMIGVVTRRLIQQHNAHDAVLLSLLLGSEFVATAAALNTADATGTTALHEAAAGGAAELATQLMSFGADTKAQNARGQTALHVACGQSLAVVRVLLSCPDGTEALCLQADHTLDAEPGEVEETDHELAAQRAKLEHLRAQLEAMRSALNAIDDFGKTCRVHAALAGRADVGAFIRAVQGEGDVDGEVWEDVKWGAADAAQAAVLAAEGRVPAIALLLKLGYPLASVAEPSKVTVAMAAAAHARTDLLELFMAHRVDLSAKDADGRSALHYLAGCPLPATLPLPVPAAAVDDARTAAAYAEDRIAAMSAVFVHEHAGACKVHEMLLMEQDASGATPLHHAAAAGMVFKIDLVARKGIEAAVFVKDGLGRTPLVVACACGHFAAAKYFADMGADPRVVDKDGRGALWHLYHPTARRPGDAARVIASERGAAVDAVALGVEVDLVRCLLRGGAALYSSTVVADKEKGADTNAADDDDEAAAAAVPPVVTAEQLLALSPPAAAGMYDGWETGDVLAYEHSVTLLKAVAEEKVLRSDDCWRLVVACLRFDDGSGRMFAALVEGGALEALFRLKHKTHLRAQLARWAAAGCEPRAAAALRHPALPACSVDAPEAVAGKFTVVDLQYCFYEGRTLAGWAVRLGAHKAVDKLLLGRYDPNKAADVCGNTMLHLAARHGTAPTVDSLVTLSSVPCEYERENVLGLTCLEEGALAGNFPATRRFVKFGAVARAALGTSPGVPYWGWLAALATQQESASERQLLDHHQQAYPHAATRPRLQARVEEDERALRAGWVKNNRLLGAFGRRPPAPTRPSTAVFGPVAEGTLLFHAFRDAALAGANAPRQLYGVKGLRRLWARGGLHHAATFADAAEAPAAAGAAAAQAASARALAVEARSRLVGRLVEYLWLDHDPALQGEAAAALHALLAAPAGPTHAAAVAAVVAAGARAATGVVKGLAHVLWLPSPKEPLRERAAWAVGYIAGAGAELRDRCLEARAGEAVVDAFKTLTPASDLSYVQSLAWAVSQLASGKPEPDFDAFRPALSVLARLVRHTDATVVTHACWAVRHLSEGQNYRIQAVLDTGVAPRLVELLRPEETGHRLARRPALEAISKFVTGTEKHVNKVLACDALPALVALYDWYDASSGAPSSSSSSAVAAATTGKKTILFTISNVAGTGTEQVQAAIDAGLFGKVVHVLANGPFSELQKEAVWAVLVATDGKENEAQALQLLRLGVVPPVVRLLNTAEADNKALANAVDALDNVLKAAKHAKTADDQGAAVAAVRGCGGVEALKKMQNHANVDISQKAAAVLASHFS